MKIINAGYGILSVISDGKGSTPSNAGSYNSAVERTERKITNYI